MRCVCVLRASCCSPYCCVLCSLLMFVEDARGDHMDEAYLRVRRTTVECNLKTFVCCMLFVIYGRRLFQSFSNY